MKLSVSLISGVLFAVIGVLHLLRLAYGWDAAIGGFDVPMWASWIAAAVSALLAYGNITHCHACKM